MLTDEDDIDAPFPRGMSAPICPRCEGTGVVHNDEDGDESTCECMPVRIPRIAETITDEEIRKLNTSAQKAEHMMSSATALGLQPESYPGHRADARARCAEILNERRAAEVP